MIYLLISSVNAIINGLIKSLVDFNIKLANFFRGEIEIISDLILSLCLCACVHACMHAGMQAGNAGRQAMQADRQQSPEQTRGQVTQRPAHKYISTYEV
jgi:hypothetical protein